MKPISTLLISLLINAVLMANPILPPYAEISELYFDESDNWVLELIYYGVSPGFMSIDSIILFSASDTVKLPYYELTESEGFIVYTIDSLSSDFSINRYADTIKIESYTDNYPMEDWLIFGNTTGASISYPKIGQSISRYQYAYIKDNSPTIGTINDTIGMCGTLRGTVYDKYNAPVENRTFLMDNQFTTSSAGEYTCRALSKPSSFNTIGYVTPQSLYEFVSVSEISYVMEPDSVIEMDIHLLDTLKTRVDDPAIIENPVRVFPNPVTVNGQLNIDIDLPVMTSDIWLELVDVNGKLVKKQKIGQKQTYLETPSTEGLYFLNILLDNRNISTNRIIVIHE